jgi:hypothetical protein
MVGSKWFFWRLTMVAFLLLGCTQNDKVSMDTALTEENLAVTGNTDFPEIQEDFNELYETSVSANIQDMGNITAYAGFFVAMGPLMELQIMVASEGQENITCPTIEGDFPVDGSPQEEITIVGNGCTNDDGKTYNGSLVYSPEGVTYTSYIVTTPSDNENCPDLSTTSNTNGGMRIKEAEDMPFLVKFQNEEISEDCSVQSSIAFLNGTVNIDETSSENTVINGELTCLISTEDSTMWFTVVTEEEILNSNVCETEPISGTNTMTTSEDSLVYTFDGGTDCDEEPTQMLSINGGEFVEVEGSECSVVPMRTSLLGVLFGFALTILRRRE